jgi:hypothetical protein
VLGRCTNSPTHRCRFADSGQRSLGWQPCGARPDGSVGGAPPALVPELPPLEIPAPPPLDDPLDDPPLPLEPALASLSSVDCPAHEMVTVAAPLTAASNSSRSCAAVRSLSCQFDERITLPRTKLTGFRRSSLCQLCQRIAAAAFGGSQPNSSGNLPLTSPRVSPVCPTACIALIRALAGCCPVAAMCRPGASPPARPATSSTISSTECV